MSFPDFRNLDYHNGTSWCQSGPRSKLENKTLLGAPNLKPVMIGGITLSLFQTKYGTCHELIDRLHPQQIGTADVFTPITFLVVILFLVGVLTKFMSYGAYKLVNLHIVSTSAITIEHSRGTARVLLCVMTDDQGRRARCCCCASAGWVGVRRGCRPRQWQVSSHSHGEGRAKFNLCGGKEGGLGALLADCWQPAGHVINSRSLGSRPQS